MALRFLQNLIHAIPASLSGGKAASEYEAYEKRLVAEADGESTAIAEKRYAPSATKKKKSARRAPNTGRG